MRRPQLQAFAGGAIGGFGLVAFYRAMSLNLIGVVAPITGFVAAALPVVVGLIGGDRLEVWQVAGMVVGLAALVLINGPEPRRCEQRPARREPRALCRRRLRPVLHPVPRCEPRRGDRVRERAFRVGGASLHHRAGDSGSRRSPGASALGIITIGGVFDGTGVVLYLYATHTGLLSVTALLTSFYPAFTVLCARLFTPRTHDAAAASRRRPCGGCDRDDRSPLTLSRCSCRRTPCG